MHAHTPGSSLTPCRRTHPNRTTAFLPTLERFGKVCQVLLTPDTVTLVQTPQEADGAQLTISFQVVSLCWQR
jgi:hypothetical protein